MTCTARTVCRYVCWKTRPSVVIAPMIDRFDQFRQVWMMGVCPLGAHVRRTVVLRLLPVSSRYTSVALYQSTEGLPGNRNAV